MLSQPWPPRASLVSGEGRDMSDPMNLDAADAAFLLGDIAMASEVRTRSIDWAQVGASAERIRADIEAMNIPLESPDVSVTLREIHFDGDAAILVDVSSGGGDVPDPLRFVFVVRNDDYLGNAGKVAS